MLDRLPMARVTASGGAAGNVCVKCGAADPAKRWHADTYQCSFVGTEHMHMVCGSCSYEWPTAPLDAT